MRKKNFLWLLFMWISAAAALILSAAYIQSKAWLIYGILIISVYIYFTREKNNLSILIDKNMGGGCYAGAAMAVVPLLIYFIHSDNCSRVLLMLFNRVATPEPVVVISASVFLAALSYPFILFLFKYLSEYLALNRDTLKKYSFLIKPAIILSVILCLSMITIVRSNFVYKDDMQRVVNGSTIYTREGRYLAEYIMCLLEMDTWFADISPLPQLLGMVIMAVFSVMVWHFLSERKTAGLFDIAAMSAFALTPYFLEGMSFKYDSPQHALAAFFAVFPLYYYNSSRISPVPAGEGACNNSIAARKKYLIVTALSAVILCSFHQTPMGLFPSLVIAKVFIDWNLKKKNNKELILFSGLSAAGYTAGLLIYRISLMKSIVRISLDGVKGDNTAVFSFTELIPGMIRNYKLFFGTVSEDFRPLWTALIMAICLCFLIASVYNSERQKKYAASAAVITFALLILLSFGLYPLLESPLINPRHLFSICFFVGIIAVMTVCTYSSSGVFAKSFILILMLSFFSFSIKYGNALYYQSRYTSFRTGMVASKLAEMDVLREYDRVNLLITGDIGHSPEVIHMGNNMINKLVPTMFSEYYGSWYAAALYNQYGLNIVLPSDMDAINKKEMTMLYDNYYYSIYQKKDNILVDLKEQSYCLWVE